MVATFALRLATLAQGNNEESVVEIGGREDMTTNNRMEIMAAIEALKNISENVEVEIHTDSEYLIKFIFLFWLYNILIFGNILKVV